MGVELLGRPLTFGDSEQIAHVRKLEKEAEEKEFKAKYGCKSCEKSGKKEVECFECGGHGYIEEDCGDCDGKGYLEPE